MESHRYHSVMTCNVQGPSQLPANLRNVQSSHVLQSAFPAANQQGPPPADDAGSFRPSSWDNSPSPLFTEESLRRGNSADVRHSPMHATSSPVCLQSSMETLQIRGLNNTGGT